MVCSGSTDELNQYWVKDKDTRFKNGIEQSQIQLLSAAAFPKGEGQTTSSPSKFQQTSKIGSTLIFVLNVGNKIFQEKGACIHFPHCPSVSTIRVYSELLDHLTFLSIFIFHQWLRKVSFCGFQGDGGVLNLTSNQLEKKSRTGALVFRSGGNKKKIL